MVGPKVYIGAIEPGRSPHMAVTIDCTLSHGFAQNHLYQVAATCAQGHMR